MNNVIEAEPNIMLLKMTNANNIKYQYALHVLHRCAFEEISLFKWILEHTKINLMVNNNNRIGNAKTIALMNPL